MLVRRKGLALDARNNEKITLCGEMPGALKISRQKMYRRGEVLTTAALKHSKRSGSALLHRLLIRTAGAMPTKEKEAEAGSPRVGAHSAARHGSRG